MLIAVLFGLGLRFAHLASCKNWLFDEYYYYFTTAASAYQGEGFNAAYNTEREGIFVPPPGQSWFILAMLPFCSYTQPDGSLEVVIVLPKLIQILLSGFTIILFGLIGRQLRSRLAGLIAAFSAALYPGFVHWSGYLMSESNYLLGLTLLTWLLLRWVDRPYYRRALLAAAVLGLLCFQRGNPLLLAPTLAGFSIFIMGWKRGWRPALTFMFLPMFILLPWRQFNAERHGDPVWVSSNSGILFHYANRINLDPVKTPHWDDMGSIALVSEIESQFHREDGKLNATYYRYGQAYLDHAKAYVFANPGHFLRNYFLKLWNQFTVVPSNPVSFLRSPQLWSWLHHLLLFAGTGGFVVMLTRARNRHAFLLLTVFAYFSAFGALFHLTRDGRMALVLKVYLIFYAAWFIDWLYSALRTRRSQCQEIAVADC